MSSASLDPVGPLAVPRGAVALLGAALRTLGRHPGPFIAATALVVVPILLLVDGLFGDQLAEGGDADPDAALTVLALPLVAVAVPALVTALHCTLAPRRPRIAPTR